MLGYQETEELKNQKIILTQLFNMARDTFASNEASELLARQAKLRALKLQEELRVRLEMINESLGIYPPEPEYVAGPDADQCRKKESDEHEDNPGAA